MTKTLPWIRPDVPDDVIIAGALELTWQDLTARVAVVASDRNVRLKARRAGLSTLRPENA
jgi:predicted ribonuclease YlaK